MYNARRATGWVSVFYFVSLIIMGMMIVMNLFLAILLSNFTNKDDVDAAAGGGGNDDQGNAAPAVEGMASPRVTPYNPASPPLSPLPNARANTTGGKSLLSTKTFKSGDVSTTDGKGSGGGASCAGGKVIPTANSGEGGGDEGTKTLIKGKPGGVSRVCAACKTAAESAFEECMGALRGLRVPDDLDPGKALFLLGPNNPVRQGCAAVVANPGFDRFILLLISVSSLALALDNPLRNPDSHTAEVLGRVERVMTALFFVEMALKIFAQGFVFMNGAYLRSSWNVLDFVVVVISLIQLFTDDSGNLESLRSLRTLRALRPLRYVQRLSEQPRDLWGNCVLQRWRVVQISP